LGCSIAGWGKYGGLKCGSWEAKLGIASGLSILAIALPLLNIIVICAVFIFMIKKGYRKLIKPKRTEGASP